MIGSSIFFNMSLAQLFIYDFLNQRANTSSIFKENHPCIFLTGKLAFKELIVTKLDSV